ANGELEATLVEQHVLEIELAASGDIKSVVKLDEEIPHVIAVRNNNERLKEVLNTFIKRVYKSEFYNVLYSKYFKSRESVARLNRNRVTDLENGKISPFDNLVQKYSDKYGFDWRLIAAQMFQESGFDPAAKSHRGARGLMQVMPRTARSLGIEKINEPAGSIQAGVKYMDWLRDRFDDELPLTERLWFSLAAYNAGIGHVRDARRLARKLGKDPDKWFDNTEQAMLLLSKKHYAKKARYGFVNGREPVNYVREIKQRFEAYVELGSKTFGRYAKPREFVLARLPGGNADQFIDIIRRTASRKVVSGFF
ncbi:MAG: transglycosylase SLT domain-containing protein, partial [Gammaproteobacteria bacterium]|nr:transglycosylase SLT domain-containing protein [Gammaproteobacteria bacterium]